MDAPVWPAPDVSTTLVPRSGLLRAFFVEVESMHKKANTLTDQLKAIGMFFFVLTMVSSPVLLAVGQEIGRGPLAESTQVEEPSAE